MLKLVKFSTPSCSKCKIQAHEIDKFQSDFQTESLVVESINLYSQPDVAAELQILSVPTTIVYRDGQQIARWTGIKRAEELQEIIKQSSAD